MQEADSNLTPTGKMGKTTIGEVCSWVIKSWNGVKKEIVIKSFKKCGISNAMDGTEDDAIYEEELIEMAGRLNTDDTSDEDFHGFHDK